VLILILGETRSYHYPRHMLQKEKENENENERLVFLGFHTRCPCRYIPQLAKVIHPQNKKKREDVGISTIVAVPKTSFSCGHPRHTSETDTCGKKGRQTYGNRGKTRGHIYSRVLTKLFESVNRPLYCVNIRLEMPACFRTYIQRNRSLSSSVSYEHISVIAGMGI
jgi:hypothetical protein